MDLNHIIQHIHVETYNLVKEAKKACSNQFSPKIFYIKVQAEELESSIDLRERNKKMIKFLTKRKLLNEKEIALEIEAQQKNLSWIDFELYHTSVITVIMAIFVLKEESHENLQFHFCFNIPPWTDKNFNPKYLTHNSFKTIIWNLKYKDYLKRKKFDLNWRQKSLTARWNIFWWEKMLVFLLKV